VTEHPFIEAAGLEKTFPEADGRLAVLSGLDLSVRRGERVTILGVSGTGKSTLLNIVGGIDRPTAGSLRVDGREVSALDDRGLTLFRRELAGFVFQFYNLLPSLTAAENVMTALEAAGDRSGDARERSLALLEAVGLGGKADKFPEQLSGGEQQRVAIARALVKRPPLILADEPTGNLDPATGEKVLDLLVDQAGTTGATLLIVTHDPRIGRLTDRVLALESGRLVPR
jgi:putative ABC transport system ATP-binding protein